MALFVAAVGVQVRERAMSAYGVEKLERWLPWRCQYSKSNLAEGVVLMPSLGSSSGLPPKFLLRTSLPRNLSIDVTTIPDRMP